MKNNRIGDNPALAAILKTVKANTNKAIEKDYKTTKLAPTKDSPGLVYEYNKTLDAIVANPVEDPPNIIKENEYLKEQNGLLEKRILRLEHIIDMCEIEINYLKEARKIHESIEKEVKEGKYSRWKQL